MTSAEKVALARFLDTAGDMMETGYHEIRPEPVFEDDPLPRPPPVEAKPATPPIDRTPAVPQTDAPPDTLERITAEIAACERCGLCRTRKNTVPGEGVTQPQVLVVGEAPGAEEDAQGRPFVGEAGKLLDRMLASIELSRTTNCFIVNTLKCRPPGNRDPTPEERAACMGYLTRQIALFRPKAILCAGRIAAQTLLKEENTPLSAIRGRKWDFSIVDTAGNTAGQTADIPLFATYHPSALLRDERWKRPAWEDLKAFRAFLDEP
jgi:DNA polymerase